MRKAKNTIKLSDVNIEDAIEYFGITVIPHTIDDGFTVVDNHNEENWRCTELELQSMLLQAGMRYAVLEFKGELEKKR